MDSFFQKLKVNLLLLLQLLALIALILALARPHRSAPGTVADKLVVILDVSASMQARSDLSSRFEEARQEAMRLVRGAPRGSEVMIVAAGRQVRVVLPFTSDRAQALAELTGLEAEDVKGDLSALKSLMLSVAGSHPQADLFLLGDSLPEGPLHPRLRFLGFGTAADNVAVSAFQVTLDHSGSLLVFAAFQSYSSQVESFTARFLRDGQELRRRRVVLPADSRRTVVFPVPPEGSAAFEVRIEPDDALAVDDRAFALAPEARPVTVALRGRVNRFLEKALLSIPEVRLFRSPSQDRQYDAEVWPGPPEQVGAPLALLLRPPPEWSSGDALEGAFPLSAGRAEVMDGLVLQGLWVRRLEPLTPPPGAEVLLEAGGRPALVLAHQQEATLVVFGFDLYDSNLPLSPAFPILLSQVVSRLSSGQSRGFPAQIETGQPLTVRTTGAVEVTAPGGTVHRAESSGEESAFLHTGTAGFYQVTVGDSTRLAAANLTAEAESALQDAPPSQEGVLSPGEPAVQQESLIHEYWWEMVLVVLLILMAEWFLYHQPGRSG